MSRSEELRDEAHDRAVEHKNLLLEKKALDDAEDNLCELCKNFEFWKAISQNERSMLIHLEQKTSLHLETLNFFLKTDSSSS